MSKVPPQVWMGVGSRIPHDVVPQGGWKFQHGSVQIRGNSWEELVKNVKEHRKSNNIHIGNVEREIEEQIMIVTNQTQPGMARNPFVQPVAEKMPEGTPKEQPTGVIDSKGAVKIASLTPVMMVVEK